MPPELQAALRKALTPEEQTKLEIHWTKVEREALRSAIQDTMDIIYVIILRIVVDRLGADRDKLEEMVTLIDEYLTDMGTGKLKTSDLVSSLRADGLDIKEILGDRICIS